MEKLNRLRKLEFSEHICAALLQRYRSPGRQSATPPPPLDHDGFHDSADETGNDYGDGGFADTASDDGGPGLGGFGDLPLPVPGMVTIFAISPDCFFHGKK